MRQKLPTGTEQEVTLSGKDIQCTVLLSVENLNRYGFGQTVVIVFIMTFIQVQKHQKKKLSN